MKNIQPTFFYISLLRLQQKQAKIINQFHIGTRTLLQLWRHRYLRVSVCLYSVLFLLYRINSTKKSTTCITSRIVNYRFKLQIAQTGSNLHVAHDKLNWSLRTKIKHKFCRVKKSIRLSSTIYHQIRRTTKTLLPLLLPIFCQSANFCIGAHP